MEGTNPGTEAAVSHIKSSLTTARESGSQLGHRKETPTGKKVTRINEHGKNLAKEIHATMPEKQEIPLAIQSMRAEITSTLKQIKQELAAQHAKELADAGKTKRKVGAKNFNAEVRARFDADFRVHEAHVDRQILASIAARARREEKKHLLTPEHIARVRAELGDKVPDAFATEIAAARLRKESAEQPQEVKPDDEAEKGKSVKEMATEKVGKLAASVQQRIDSTRIGIIQKAQEIGWNTKEIIGGALQSSVKRPALVAFSSIAIIGALSTPFIMRGVSASVASAEELARPAAIVRTVEQQNPSVSAPFEIRQTNRAPTTSERVTAPAVRAEGVLASGKHVQIEGYGDNYTIMVRDATTNQVSRVPITDVEVTKGKVEKEIAPNKYLGIRNNVPESMDKVKEMGGSSVRIAGGGYSLEENPELKRALDAAEKQNLDTLYVYNPTEMPSDADMLSTLESILKYNNVKSIELGNEPDTGLYWKDNNLEEYAKFVAKAAKMVQEIRPGTKIIIGALVNIGKTEELAKYLLQNGINPNGNKDMAVAVHAYHSEQEVRDRVAEVKRVFGENTEVICTELGVDNKDTARSTDNILGKMLTASAELTHNTGYVHQITEYVDKSANDEGEHYGLMANGKTLVTGNIVQSWAKNYKPAA